MIDALFRVVAAPSLRDAWYSSKLAFLIALSALSIGAVGLVGVIYRIT